MSGSAGAVGGPRLDLPRERSTNGSVDPRVAPDFFCSNPSRGVAWLYADGSLGYVRCGASNRCDYCGMLAACENAVVLRLDAFDGQGRGGLSEWFPRVGLTTTTRRPGFALAELRAAEQKLWRQLRREFGRSIEYCGFLEWTTGRASSSGGWRRPHLHHLVKGLAVERAEDVRSRASELWRGYADGAWQVECRPLYTPMGAIAYLVLHHHKREQGPPPGTKHAKRLRPSRRYFRRPIAELRREARELLRDERLVGELVAALGVPDGAPSYMVEELIAEKVDEAREAAARDRPRLVHVHERREVDRATGEVRYVFQRVLGLADARG